MTGTRITRQFTFADAMVRFMKFSGAVSAIVGIASLGSAPLFAAAEREKPVVAGAISITWIGDEPGGTAETHKVIPLTPPSHADAVDLVRRARPTFEAMATNDRPWSRQLKKLLADFDALEASRTASPTERTRLLKSVGAAYVTRTSGAGIETTVTVHGRPRLRVLESALPRAPLPRVERPDGAPGPSVADTEPAWRGEVEDAIQQFYDLNAYLAAASDDAAAAAQDVANGIANGEFDGEDCPVIASGPSDSAERRDCFDFAVHSLGELLGFGGAAAGVSAMTVAAYNNFVAFMGSAELAAMGPVEAAAAVSSATTGFVASLTLGWIAAAALVGCVFYVAYEAYKCRHARDPLGYTAGSGPKVDALSGR